MIKQFKMGICKIAFNELKFNKSSHKTTLQKKKHKKKHGAGNLK